MKNIEFERIYAIIIVTSGALKEMNDCVVRNGG